MYAFSGYTLYLRVYLVCLYKTCPNDKSTFRSDVKKKKMSVFNCEADIYDMFKIIAPFMFLFLWRMTNKC